MFASSHPSYGSLYSLTPLTSGGGGGGCGGTYAADALVVCSSLSSSDVRLSSIEAAPLTTPLPGCDDGVNDRIHTHPQTPGLSAAPAKERGVFAGSVASSCPALTDTADALTRSGRTPGPSSLLSPASPVWIPFSPRSPVRCHPPSHSFFTRCATAAAMAPGAADAGREAEAEAERGDSSSNGDEDRCIATLLVGSPIKDYCERRARFVA